MGWDGMELGMGWSWGWDGIGQYVMGVEGWDGIGLSGAVFDGMGQGHLNFHVSPKHNLAHHSFLPWALARFVPFAAILHDMADEGAPGGAANRSTWRSIAALWSCAVEHKRCAYRAADWQGVRRADGRHRAAAGTV